MVNKEELKKEAEEKYCNGCKLRIEQCLWAWRNTNGLNEPNEKNCSCKEVPAYITGAEPREKRIAELEEKLEQTEKDLADYQFNYPTIKELQKENAELKRHIKADCIDCADYYKNKRLEKENADLKEEINKIAFARGNLEEENAKLKEKVNILDNCDRLGDVITEAYKDQLTKAKELLKQFLEAKNSEATYKAEWEAEQFLKDSEVEK